MHNIIFAHKKIIVMVVNYPSNYLRLYENQHWKKGKKTVHIAIHCYARTCFFGINLTTFKSIIAEPLSGQ